MTPLRARKPFISIVQRQTWAQTAWSFLQDDPRPFITGHDFYGAILPSLLCQAISDEAVPWSQSVMDRTLALSRSFASPDKWMEKVGNTYIWHDRAAEARDRQQKQREKTAGKQWVLRLWQDFLDETHADQAGWSVSRVRRHFDRRLLSQWADCPYSLWHSRLSVAVAPKHQDFQRQRILDALWNTLPMTIAQLPGLPPFIVPIGTAWKDADTPLLRKKRAISQQRQFRAQDKYRERYYQLHQTTKATAETVWQSLGIVRSMPFPGFWNEGTEPWWSHVGLRATPEVGLLSHFGLHHSLVGLHSVGFAATPYGVRAVYWADDIRQAQERLKTRQASYAPSRILTAPTITELVGCLVIVNRHARKVSRLLPSLYTAHRFGLVAYWKDRKDAAYALKDAALLRLASAAEISWHHLPHGWHAALTFQGPNSQSYTLHLPAIPDTPPRTALTFDTPFPVRLAPSWTFRGYRWRLQDAWATLEHWVSITPVPDTVQPLAQAHGRSQAVYRSTQIVRRSYYNDHGDDDDGDWNSDEEWLDE